MEKLKKIAVLSLLLIGFFSFKKPENPIIKLKLEKLNVIELLSKQEFECRPSSEFVFYVDTKLVKKYREFIIVNTIVYVLDRASGQSNLLSTEKIIIPFNKAAVLQYHTVSNGFEEVLLPNIDQVMCNDIKSKYSFEKLIEYETIYNSYIRSINKLLIIESKS